MTLRDRIQRDADNIHQTLEECLASSYNLNYLKDYANEIGMDSSLVSKYGTKSKKINWFLAIDEYESKQATELDNSELTEDDIEELKAIDSFVSEVKLEEFKDSDLWLDTSYENESILYDDELEDDTEDDKIIEIEFNPDYLPRPVDLSEVKPCDDNYSEDYWEQVQKAESEDSQTDVTQQLEIDTTKPLYTLKGEHNTIYQEDIDNPDDITLLSKDVLLIAPLVGIKKVVNKDDLIRVYYWSDVVNNMALNPSVSMLYQPTTIERNTRLKIEGSSGQFRRLKVVYDKSFIVWRLSRVLSDFGSVDILRLREIFEEVLNVITEGNNAEI